MRTRKNELISDELKPFIGNLIRENRQKYNYSLEDLSLALNHQKNRQTLHKYETGLLNIPYDILFQICDIFNIDISLLKDIDISKEERKIIETKFVKNYLKNSRLNNDMTVRTEKLINTYKNAHYEPIIGKSELVVKILDDSMEPYYHKNDLIYFQKQEDYQNGDDIIIATKNNILSVRKLYKYPKGIILQAMNPKYPSININIISSNMIIGKVIAIHREIK